MEEDQRESMERGRRKLEQEPRRDAEKAGKMAAEEAEKPQAAQRQLRKYFADKAPQTLSRAQVIEFARPASPAFQDVFPLAPASEGESSSQGWNGCPVEEVDSEEIDSEEYDNVTVSSAE